MAKFNVGDVLLEITYNSLFEVITLFPGDDIHTSIYVLKHLSGPQKGTTFLKVTSIIDRDCVYSKSGSVLYGSKIQT